MPYHNPDLVAELHRMSCEEPTDANIERLQQIWLNHGADIVKSGPSEADVLLQDVTGKWSTAISRFIDLRSKRREVERRARRAEQIAKRGFVRHNLIRFCEWSVRRIVNFQIWLDITHNYPKGK